MSSADSAFALPPDRPAARSFAGELQAMLRIAIPIVVVQVGMMAMGTVDTMIVGRVSASALASVALGNLYFFIVAAFGWGVLMVLDPVIAQAIGAEDHDAVALGVQRGCILAVVLGVVLSLLMIPAATMFRLAGQSERLIPAASGYALASLPGFIPFYLFIVLRQSLQAMHRLTPIIITIVVANIANAILNWILVFGKLGAPALGAVGSAWASTISRWLMAGMLFALAWPSLRTTLRPWRAAAWQRTPLWRMLRLGVPIGIQQQLEGGLFAVVALLMGRIDTVAIAAHQVAINIAALTFMVPLGVSAAAAVLVGHGVGRGDATETRRAAVAAFVCGVGFMAVSAIAFLAAPHAIARLYTSDRGVLATAVLLIPIAGVFQVFDGLQAVAGGVLRGTGDTRSPVIANFVGFWVIGLPTSIYLGFYTTAGARGLWWGLVVGLAVVSAVLVVLVRRRLQKKLRRVMIDAPELG